MARIGFVCPVPAQHCHGATLNAGPGGGKAKYHGDDMQVRRCEVTYLKTLGYTRLAAREMQAPNGGEVLVLSKKPGTPVRTGKASRSMSGPATKVAW